MAGTVVTRGERELSLRFETFPTRARQKLEQRIRSLTAELEARVRAATPVKTGLLRSEVTERIYADTPDRVAGYVSVFAGGRSTEYAKAATLEYGSDKPRKISARGGKIAGLFSRGRGRIEGRVSKAPHIRAYRYLRDPLEQMRPEIEASLEEAVAEAAAEGEEG